MNDTDIEITASPATTDSVVARPPRPPATTGLDTAPRAQRQPPAPMADEGFRLSQLWDGSLPVENCDQRTP
jgi:hypothetical protein